jgi:formylglycine-generating enzyme required for sulfatase activity
MFRKLCTILAALSIAMFLLSPAVAERGAKVVKKETKQAAAPDTGYYALIIGNNDYKYLPKLKTAVTDARDIEKMLKEKYGFKTKLLLNATRNDILDSINELRETIGANGNILIYYAGHGDYKKEVEKSYWLPVDAQKDRTTNWIMADDITSNIKLIASRHILIVSDSCYAGTLTRAANTELKDKNNRDALIKKMLERPSRTVMASGGDEPVADGGGGKNSVFASALLRALDESDNSQFTASELFHDKVRAIVAGKSEQLPQYNIIRNSGDDGGDFVFQLARASISTHSVETPDVQYKEAPKSDFSLDALEKKAQQEEANKAAWNNTMKTMKGAYNKVVAYQERKVSPDLKIAAWGQFLNSFTDKNPYTNEDDEMRSKAQQEMERWQAEQAKAEEQKKLAMAPRQQTTASGSAYKDPTTGMEFVRVKGGCYQMGDTFGDGDSDEKPVHEVCVGDFYIGKYDVTVGDFRKFVNGTGYSTEAEKGDGCYAWTGSKWEKDSSKNWKNPGFSQEDRNPVVCVTWNDAKAYAEWMQTKSGKTVRLPTEAEWEYAARSGGKSEKYAGGNDIDSVAWYYGNSGNMTHPVGTKSPNGLGLYDMSGNVWQWTDDWYGDKYYSESPRNNPAGPNSGQYRVLRGGSWVNTPVNVRAASRGRGVPAGRTLDLGFRLALSAR